MPETIITTDDLKKELTAQDYGTLSFDDAAVSERAIQKAVIWVYGKVKSTGNDYNEENEVIRDIVLKRAVYELFSYIGQESRAKMKEKDAADLIETYFGSISTKYNEGPGPAAGAVSVAEIPPYGS
ncbi:MAG: hypothetical protein LBH44_07680 [Treponema sp.]|jgi:hypothetical protein|nr:hypothetical protein [Treponema sp.]